MVKTKLTGVTILAMVEFGFGIFRVGLGLIALAGAFAASGRASGASAASSPASRGIFLGLEAWVIMLGLFALVVGYGLWTGKSWGWSTALILSVIGIIETVVSIPFLGASAYSHLIGIVLDVVIIYYLTRPHVKAFFAKGPMPNSLMSKHSRS